MVVPDALSGAQLLFLPDILPTGYPAVLTAGAGRARTLDSAVMSTPAPRPLAPRGQAEPAPAPTPAQKPAPAPAGPAAPVLPEMPPKVTDTPPAGAPPRPGPIVPGLV